MVHARGDLGSFLVLHLIVSGLRYQGLLHVSGLLKTLLPFQTGGDDESDFDDWDKRHGVDMDDDFPDPHSPTRSSLRSHLRGKPHPPDGGEGGILSLKMEHGGMQLLTKAAMEERESLIKSARDTNRALEACRTGLAQGTVSVVDAEPLIAAPLSAAAPLISAAAPLITTVCGCYHSLVIMLDVTTVCGECYHHVDVTTVLFVPRTRYCCVL